MGVGRSNRPTAPPHHLAAETAPGQVDRRARPRQRYDDKIVLWRREGTGVADRSTAWALNISAGGIRILHPRGLAVGERVGVGLRGRPATLPGRVVWVALRSDGCIAGIVFGWN